MYRPIIINHGVPGPSGTFSRETVRTYKNPGDQNIFQRNLAEGNFCLSNNDKKTQRKISGGNFSLKELGWSVIFCSK